MRYHAVSQGRFLDRPNRFIAHVELGGETVVCHVKNTGRCRELLVPGAAVYVERAANPGRKTLYDLIAVEKQGLLINMDAQAPNKVFGEWAAGGGFLPGLTGIRPESTWEDSRFDFLLEGGQGPCFVEVKGVTLEEGGEARFPDAPTERGVKHLRGLQRAAAQGWRAAVFFPNDRTHPEFGAALREAASHGVEVYARDCLVTPESLVLDAPVPVLLD